MCKVYLLWANGLKNFQFWILFPENLAWNIEHRSWNIVHVSMLKMQLGVQAGCYMQGQSSWKLVPFWCSNMLKHSIYCTFLGLISWQVRFYNYFLYIFILCKKWILFSKFCKRRSLFSSWKVLGIFQLEVQKTFSLNFLGHNSIPVDHDYI